MPGYGTPLSLTLPTINGVAKESAAAPLINTALSAIIARLESKVGAADLDINADVSFKSGAVFSGAKDLQRAAFQSQGSALTAVSNPNTVYVLNGDLHYIDQAGNLIQITASGAVNVSTTGGITGAGYGTGGVEVNWDSGNSRFAFKSGAGADDFADVQVSDVLLRDGTGNTIRFQAPAISSDYSVTLPAAAPASTVLLQMSSAGLITASNSLASGAHLTLVGTGRLKHGTFTYPVDGGAFYGSGDVIGDDARLTSTGDGIFYSVPIIVGKRLIACRVRMNDTLGDVTVTLLRKTTTGGTTSLASATSNSSGDQTVTVTSTQSQNTSTVMHLRVVRGVTAGTAQLVYMVEFDYDEA